MHKLSQNIQELPPSYFGLVMATGILSIGAFLNKMSVLATGLFFTTVVFMGIFSTLFAYRCIRFPQKVIADFKSYQNGPVFFTIVAAFCLLGNQIILLYEYMVLVKVILIASVFCWFILIYGFFYNITISKNKKPLKEGISGSWLLITVATQALSTLVSFASQSFGEEAYLCLFVGLCLFLTGSIFYLYFMSLIVYRMSFFPLNAKALGAPYWINMGATAITTLSGSMLILHTGHFHFIVDILPFLKGFTLFFWAAGTWWIPLLIILGIWRHLIQKTPVPSSTRGYSSTYWGMVFPLGMYTVCCFRLSEALEIAFLKNIPGIFIYIALFTWGVVMVGFIKNGVLLFKPEGSTTE